MALNFTNEILIQSKSDLMRLRGILCVQCVVHTVHTEYTSTLASAYEDKWSVLSLATCSCYQQCTVSVLVL